MGYENFISPGERLGAALPQSPAGYDLYPIEPERKDRNAVLFVIPPGVMTEHFFIIKPIKMVVRTLGGIGVARVFSVDRQQWKEHPLELTSQPVHIGQGDVYSYHNHGNQELIMRDDCTPPFQDGDEIEVAADNVRSLRLPS